MTYEGNVYKHNVEYGTSEPRKRVETNHFRAGPRSQRTAVGLWGWLAYEYVESYACSSSNGFEHFSRLGNESGRDASHNHRDGLRLGRHGFYRWFGLFFTGCYL